LQFPRKSHDSIEPRSSGVLQDQEAVCGIKDTYYQIPRIRSPTHTVWIRAEQKEMKKQLYTGLSWITHLVGFPFGSVSPKKKNEKSQSQNHTQLVQDDCAHIGSLAHLVSHGRLHDGHQRTVQDDPHQTN
jgi:hypothetical protein